MESIYFVGVDVGTGSARAAIVSSNGKLINMATCPIKTFNPRPNFFEQSSDDIWSAVCNVVKTVTKDVPEEKIKGIGFDATCSLVALDEHGRPVTVSPTGNDEQNVILWMDHRAEAESAFINSTKDEMLRYVGGKISLEMETPKMLWMKKNMPTSWLRAKMLFDLPDFLTWRATRSQSRSLCSLVCKWNYKAGPDGNNGWNAEFFNKIGLSDLSEDNWRKIGTHVKPPGDPVALGLTAEAANELGLSPKTPVGTSIIDAHAGGLGMIGCSVPGVPNNFSSRLSLICGTSTCHMAISDKEITVDGVWGPYYSVMIPRFWLSEGGQSATGKLLDHIINSHPATASIMHQLTGKMSSSQAYSTIFVGPSDIASKKEFASGCSISDQEHSCLARFPWKSFAVSRCKTSGNGFRPIFIFRSRGSCSSVLGNYSSLSVWNQTHNRSAHALRP
ncbi:FGGY carbohydrate kinase domain-containing protein isoform X3 [Neodiprion virginianus]|uniref:FGGY carbohydrate kinase domain-containing protein isoform X3 n=1 Tax=Neodiprion virginianus TaxID=2961670 RepID=UPI001EE6D328|nr:FGGY carbohydrate kinase domain-containing protein isoform X3 [Neodiprion virginianus]